MTRGKYGTKAVKRRETHELEAEIATLRHSLARTERERDDATRRLARMESSYAAERRALLADVEAGTSARTRLLEDQQVEMLNQRRDAEEALVELDKDHTKLWQWLHWHLQEEHGMGYNDSFEFMLSVLSITAGGISKIGIAGARRDKDWVSLVGKGERMVAAIQRARGTRR